jgi:hypothetical protein
MIIRSSGRLAPLVVMFLTTQEIAPLWRIFWSHAKLSTCRTSGARRHTHGFKQGSFRHEHSFLEDAFGDLPASLSRSQQMEKMGSFRQETLSRYIFTLSLRGAADFSV